MRLYATTAPLLCYRYTNSMTIQDFCVEHRLPISTTSRLIRKTVNDRLRAEYPGRHATDSVGFDFMFEEHGFTAARSDGTSRIQYHVHEPEQLYKYLLDHFKYDVLEDRELDRLAGAANFLLEMVDGEADWKIVHRVSGHTFTPKREYFDELRQALARIGY